MKLERVKIDGKYYTVVSVRDNEIEVRDVTEDS